LPTSRPVPSLPALGLASDWLTLQLATGWFTTGPTTGSRVLPTSQKQMLHVFGKSYKTKAS
jgi:hypothetical protein